MKGIDYKGLRLKSQDTEKVNDWFQDKRGIRNKVKIEKGIIIKDC